MEVDLPAWGTGTRVLPNVVLISVATHSSTTSHSVRAYDGKLSLLSICTDARLTAAVWHSPGKSPATPIRDKILTIFTNTSSQSSFLRTFHTEQRRNKLKFKL